MSLNINQRGRLHIVIDCRMINASGIGTYLRNIVPGIVESDIFSVTALGIKHDLENLPWFKKATFISLQSKILTIKEQFELPYKIPKCDIYWSPNINGSIWFTRAKSRITTIHDVFHLAHSTKYSAPKLLFINSLVRSSIFHSKCIITVSNFSKQEILKYTGCQSAKIAVSHLAVEEDFNLNFKIKTIDYPYFLFVGNVKPHKNLETALKAFSRVDKSYKFLIVGKKEGFITGYSNTDGLINDLSDRVQFTGYVEEDELKNFYKNAKALIFPSLYEGFGLPVLEAMKFNIPVIAANTTAIPEVGGDAIEYFNPRNAAELAEKMSDVIEGKITADKTKYKKQLENFSWSQTILNHICVFEKTCKSVINNK